MTTEAGALFLHVLMVIASFAMAAVLHAALLLLRSARESAEARPWPAVIRRLEPLLPAGALVILLSGWWLLHLSGGEAGWSDGWVATSLAALVVAEMVGAAIGPRVGRLCSEIRAAPPGPVGPGLQELIRDPVLWCAAHFNTAVFLGVVYLMVAKPSTGWSVAAVLIAGAAGILSALPFVSRPGTTASFFPPRHRHLTG